MSPFDAMFHLAGAPALRQTFSVRVTLQRQGATDTSNVAAEPRKREYEDVVPTEGMPDRIEHRDYVIEVAEYAFGGTASEPRRGDRIVESINGTSYTFEVLPLGNSLAAQHEDASGKRWMIHTKKVA